MPIPLILSALAAGATLVLHSAGGMIVSSAGSYVAGTYLSTFIITWLLAGGATLLGTGAAVVSGAAAAVIGSAGIFCTTIGASGLTGMLMSAGIISSIPIWVPFAVAGAGAGVVYGGFHYYKLRKKLLETPEGQEAMFTESEAKFVERLLRKIAKKPNADLT